LKEKKDSGAAILRWEYDPQGKVVKTVFLNRNEKVIYEK